MMGHNPEGRINGPSMAAAMGGAATPIAPSLASVVDRLEGQARQLDELCNAFAGISERLVPLGNRVKDNSKGDASNLSSRLHGTAQYIQSSIDDLNELARILYSAVGGDEPRPAKY